MGNNNLVNIRIGDGSCMNSQIYYSLANEAKRKSRYRFFTLFMEKYLTSLKEYAAIIYLTEINFLNEYTF